MFILTVHYKKDNESDTTYYQEHILSRKEAYMFRGNQFDVGSSIYFKSIMCYLHNDKYIGIEEQPTNKVIDRYVRHEIKKNE